MNVMEGISFARDDGTWLKIEVSLDDSDFDRLTEEWAIGSRPVREAVRHAILSTMAEVLVFQRVAQARRHDTSWYEERDAWKADVLGRLRQLKEKVSG